MPIACTEVTLTSAGQYSAPVSITGLFNVSVGGSGWVATVTIQRSFDGGTSWRDVKRLTEPAELADEEAETLLYRVGCKSGEFVSGSIPCRISR